MSRNQKWHKRTVNVCSCIFCDTRGADLPPYVPVVSAAGGDYGNPLLAAQIQAPGNSISNSVNAASMTSPWRRPIGLRHCQHPSLTANGRGDGGWGEGHQVFVLYCRVGGKITVLLYGAGVCDCVCAWLCVSMYVYILCMGESWVK